MAPHVQTISSVKDRRGYRIESLNSYEVGHGTIRLETGIEAILSRMDRSSSDALLRSLAEEFVRLYAAHRSLLARLTAIELTETINDRIAPHLGISVPLATRVTCDAAFSLPASEFYPLEYDYKGLPYRWTGPDPNFHFQFFIKRNSPANLHLRYITAAFNPPQGLVRCSWMALRSSLRNRS